MDAIGDVLLEHCSYSYNNVRPLEQQCTAVSRSTLFELAKIFIRHDEHAHFGVCLLHRHHSLEDGYVMVHNVGDDEEDICKAEEVGQRSLRPRSYFPASPSEFLPFEYEVLSGTPLPSPKDDFLEELQSFLWGKNHQETFGLVRAYSGRWTELVQRDGTIARNNSEKFEQENGIITEWSFTPQNGQIQLNELRKCVEPVSGGHKTE